MAQAASAMTSLAPSRQSLSCKSSSRQGTTLRSSASLVLLSAGGSAASTYRQTSQKQLRPLSLTLPAASTRPVNAAELKFYGQRLHAGFTACWSDYSFDDLNTPPSCADSKGSTCITVHVEPADVIHGIETKAAETIQRNQRGHSIRKKLQSTRQKEDKAAIKIQSRERGARVRREKSRRCKAATTIQRGIRVGRQRRSSVPSPVQLRKAEEVAERLVAELSDNVELRREVSLALARNPPLARLELDHLIVGPAAACKLATALRRNDTLEVLEVGNCYIGCEGACSLASSLARHPRLLTLGLTWNSIGDEGAGRLATLLPTLPYLEHLDLSYNRIGDEGACALAASVDHMPALTELSLQANRMGYHGITQLRDACCKRNVDLHLGGNNSEA
eukprot:CAMPEP_0172670654 /NCGR_PEP_ID=MMETSP1074-20121228/10431_1 /TAXON_ID=2916 /ORGANISM="Ceratium fusus, Strain PA161109" /LENGTH=390 /DNA_ID=CAMNT_0013487593 /DNA_START=36 /DNA_END=1208 /DNA_ORIENTATION=+